MVFKCYVFYKPFCVYVLTRAGVHLYVRAFPSVHAHACVCRPEANFIVTP